MPTILLGRRYERLLFFAGPLAFAAAIVLFSAIASTNQKERIEASCYERAVNALEENMEVLEKSFQQNRPDNGEAYLENKHNLRIRTILITLLKSKECEASLGGAIETWYKNTPENLISHLQAAADTASRTPLAFYGIQLPEKSSLNLFGIAIDIEMNSFTRLLQIVLAPVIILWLGSLYSTRFRESLVIGRAGTIAEVFPHAVNFYPNVQYPDIKKKNWTHYYLPTIYAWFYAVIRIILLLLFVGPPVVAYLVSLIFLGSSWYPFFFAIIGLVVFILTILTVILEFMPWHFRKVFPGLPLKI